MPYLILILLVTFLALSSLALSCPGTSPSCFGPWDDFNQGDYNVALDPSLNDNGGGNWNITGIQTLAENMPIYDDGHYFKYSGPVWGHATRGATVGGGSVDYNDGDRVSGKVTAWYFPFREFGPQVDGASSHIDGVTLSLSQMKKELPNGEYRGLPGMMFPGLGVGDNVATFNGPSSMEYNNRRDRKYGPATGYIEGSFYGPNGESAAGTFNYTRRGHKIEGAFGADRLP